MTIDHFISSNIPVPIDKVIITGRDIMSQIEAIANKYDSIHRSYFVIKDNDVGIKSATIDNSFEISLLVSLHALSSAKMRLPSTAV